METLEKKPAVAEKVEKKEVVETDPTVKVEEERLIETVKDSETIFGALLENIELSAETVNFKGSFLERRPWYVVMTERIQELNPEVRKAVETKGKEVENRWKLDQEREKFFKKYYGISFSTWSRLQNALLERDEFLGNIKKSGAEKNFVVSEQERLDSLMDISQGGWLRYWAKRLIPESSIISPHLFRIVKKTNDEKKLVQEEQFAFGNYIIKRIAAKRFELRKRAEIARLKKDLQDIDAERDSSLEGAGEQRTIYYDEISGSFLVKKEDGSKQEISFGDLLGDYSWGIRYKPDKSMPHKVWRKIRKTLSLYETREKVLEVFNDELNNNYHTGHPVSAVSIDFINKLVERHENRAVAGELAERMIVEFLTRIQYNNPELKLKIEKSNALEDTILKYDFKMILNRRRGIALKSEDTSRSEFVKNRKRLGIQFTISKHPTLIEKKTGQIKNAKLNISQYERVLGKKVDDIVLVSIFSLGEFVPLYKRWLKEGKPSGGPEQYLSREQKLDIFKQTTSGLLNLSEEELAKLRL